MLRDARCMRLSLPEALRGLEVVDLLLRAVAAEHLVAMREAAEAGDDVAMLDRILVILLIAQRGEQRAAELLVAEVLAVLERHEEEHAHFRHIGGGIAASQRDAGRLARLAIAAEGP